jgi:hypothetical protein
MRIAKDEVAKRESLALSMFRANSDLTANTVNEEVKKQFGTYMRTTRLNELRKQIRLELKGDGKEATGRKASRKSVIQGTPEIGDAAILKTDDLATGVNLQKALETLHTRFPEACKVKVVHVSENQAIVTTI